MTFNPDKIEMKIKDETNETNLVRSCGKILVGQTIGFLDLIQWNRLTSNPSQCCK